MFLPQAIKFGISRNLDLLWDFCLGKRCVCRGPEARLAWAEAAGMGP